MNIAVHQPITHTNTLLWAIIGSLLLHGLLVLVIPDMRLDEVKMPDILEVELVKKPEPPPPPPVVPPEPVQPQPKIIQPKPLPKPVIKPLPTPVVEKIEPMVEQPTPPPDVIAVAPKAEATPPVHTVPTPVPVKQEPPPLVKQTDIDDARGRYGNALWSAISKHKKYPKIAQMRGWQGEATVELLLDGDGKIKSKKITQSSGYEALDKQALEMVEKAQPFPTPPEALRGSNFTITVPVPFKLE
ncbi:MAG: energy transducer TonB [Methylotenera sp.]|nr:energy transducer TonB [Methylotenera sp.]MDP2103026.1 energy transducer TonB [Methylotenera sp.]MDP2281541.1 energy transducer TonB [Methylotenera sp.]MDP2402898.1 energy transducer TonB [Methylotenera sp.]MDP3059772.1 energy transducer TonB [Methylotenera sp.]